ncbi:MAG TPA: thermonuclease family protein, partial [Candidatus Saccharimonadales bacterium]
MSRIHLTNRRLLLILALALGAVIIAFGHLNDVLKKHQPGLYSVNRFIDGDTIIVNMNGHTEKIRFIGVDTPETHKPNTPVQCYGPAAAAFTKSTIGHSRVRLVSDSLSTDRDRYGRLLRYVYLPNGTNVDQELIRTGHGFYYPYFPFTKTKQFAAAEQS